jgi:hypothetical protein
VMAALTVEPAYASLTVEHLKVLISRAPCRVLALGSASPSGTFSQWWIL